MRCYFGYKSDNLFAQIAVRPELYARMERFVRGQAAKHDVARRALLNAETTKEGRPKASTVSNVYNAVYDIAKTSNKPAIDLLREIGDTCKVSLALPDGSHCGPDVYQPGAVPLAA